MAGKQKYFASLILAVAFVYSLTFTFFSFFVANTYGAVFLLATIVSGVILLFVVFGKKAIKPLLIMGVILLLAVVVGFKILRHYSQTGSYSCGKLPDGEIACNT